jgi:hypothetical protein
MINRWNIRHGGTPINIGSIGAFLSEQCFFNMPQSKSHFAVQHQRTLRRLSQGRVSRHGLTAAFSVAKTRRLQSSGKPGQENVQKRENAEKDALFVCAQATRLEAIMLPGFRRRSACPPASNT